MVEDAAHRVHEQAVRLFRLKVLHGLWGGGQRGAHGSVLCCVVDRDNITPEGIRRRDRVREHACAPLTMINTSGNMPSSAVPAEGFSVHWEEAAPWR